MADAIRWVLGEQSIRALRGRKTEDVLFNGGDGRPPAGVAEVTLTFERPPDQFEIPYQELAVTRRAYRS